MRQAFINFNELKAAGNTKYSLNVELLNKVELDDFDKFINQLSKFPQDEKLWFNMTTPLMSWLSYETKQADYILRGEHLEEDFKIIQEYFCTEFPLVLKPAIEYKEFYTTASKNTVAKLFEQDIDQFKYVF
jgi:hypothetical protein